MVLLLREPESGRLYAISVIRGADNHITGFSGTATVFADAAFNDGGVAYGPGSVLFLSRWPVNQLGQTRPGSMITDKIIDLTPFGVASSHAALNFVPVGFPGAGQLKLVSFSGGQWYTATFSPDGLGTFNIDSVTLETTIDGGPEGFIYVPPGSPQFPDFNSMLVSEFSNGSVAAYQLDANGDPIPTTCTLFISGLNGAEGATIDPLTGDFLFSTFGGGDRVIVVRGFAAPVIGEIAMVLGTPLGDGNLSVAVDGYGSFGSSVGPEISDAIYDPVGPIEPAGTTFQSGVAIRLGAVGGRTFLTTGDIGGSGGLANPGFTAVTPDGCQATPPCASAMSVFSFGGLDIILAQAVEELISEGVRMGSRLTQTYTISNFGTVPAAFELIRYFDGDLQFDGSIVDGGGRIVVGQQEILFETDMAGEPAASTTFVGITGNGGSAEPPDRFEVDFFPVLQAKISGGGTLDDIVTNDGPDADERLIAPIPWRWGKISRTS